MLVIGWPVCGMCVYCRAVSVRRPRRTRRGRLGLFSRMITSIESVINSNCDERRSRKGTHSKGPVDTRNSRARFACTRAVTLNYKTHTKYSTCSLPLFGLFRITLFFVHGTPAAARELCTRPLGRATYRRPSASYPCPKLARRVRNNFDN